MSMTLDLDQVTEGGHRDHRASTTDLTGCPVRPVRLDRSDRCQRTRAHRSNASVRRMTRSVPFACGAQCCDQPPQRRTIPRRRASSAVGAWVVKLLLDDGIDVVAICRTEDDRRLRLVVHAEELIRLQRIDAVTLDPPRLRTALSGVTHVVDASARVAAQGGTSEAPVELLDASGRAAVRGASFEDPVAVGGLDPALDHGARHRVAERCFDTGGVTSVGLRTGLTTGWVATTGRRGRSRDRSARRSKVAVCASTTRGPPTSSTSPTSPAACVTRRAPVPDTRWWTCAAID